MTISIAWIRTVGDYQELNVVSDSRLSGCGFRLDESKKISILPRGDAFFSFAGTTDIAFPLLHQVEQTISSYNQSMNRSMDLTKLKGHLLMVINSLVDKLDYGGLISSGDINHKEKDVKDIEFLFGGYSWKEKGFKVWLISYSMKEKTFLAHDMKDSSFENIIIAGDLKEVALEKLYEILRKNRSDSSIHNVSLDMEPFCAVVELLREKDPEKHTIGGAPQLIKVYPYMTAKVIGVVWEGKRTILGRKIFDYENTSCMIIDPDTYELVVPPYVKNSINEENFREEMEKSIIEDVIQQAIFEAENYEYTQEELEELLKDHEAEEQRKREEAEDWEEMRVFIEANEEMIRDEMAEEFKRQEVEEEIRQREAEKTLEFLREEEELDEMALKGVLNVFDE